MFVFLFFFSLHSLHGFESPCNSDSVPFKTTNGGYDCVDSNMAYKESMYFLSRNLPADDDINKGSLGFNPTENFYPCIASVSTNASLSIKSSYSWAADVSKEMFMEYVLPYAILNEARTNWKPWFQEVVQGILEATGDDLDKYTVADVVTAVNAGLWSGALGKTIVFESNQTPLIYDPMSVAVFGYASCTGVSIAFVDALRSIGVPCRVSGTPAWNDVRSNGNHNWIEVWNSDLEAWQFLEAAPAGGGETLDNPCDKWFCNPSHMANGTKFYSARWKQSSTVRYPMAWDLTNREIPGDDMTEFYQSTCKAC